MDQVTTKFATTGDALYLSQGYLANGVTYTPGLAPLLVNGDNQLTFAFSGTHSGWYLQPYGVTPNGALIPVAVLDEQTGQLTQYAAGGINPAANSAKTWRYDFPPGKFVDAYLKVVTAGTGTPTAEIFSGKSLTAPAITVSVPTVTAIGLAGGTSTLAGFLAESATTGITAYSGGGQANAVLLTTEVNRVTTVAAAGDSVKLPVSVAGMTVVIINTGANPCQVFGSGTDTINAVATGTGVSQMPNSVVIYVCTAAGVWFAEGIGSGYSGSLPTVSYANGITAFAGGGQGSAVALTAMINRVTTVGTAADSVKLPAAIPGVAGITVINAAATNSMNVFPQTGESINALSANSAFAVAAGKAASFYCGNTGQWHAILTA